MCERVLFLAWQVSACWALLCWAHNFATLVWRAYEFLFRPPIAGSKSLVIVAFLEMVTLHLIYSKEGGSCSANRMQKKLRIVVSPLQQKRELFLFVLAVISAIQCILFGRQSYILDRFHAQNGFQSLSLRETPLLEGAFFLQQCKEALLATALLIRESLSLLFRLRAKQASFFWAFS